MLGHKLPGMRSHYMKPDIETLLEGTKEIKGYIAAIDSLTINDENRLSMQVQELKEKEDYQNYVIDKQLKEKDLEIEKMQQQLERLTSETSRNRQEFIDIAKKIREIKEEEKIDPFTKEKIEAGIINKEELFDSWCEIEDRREQQQDEIEEWIEQKSSSKVIQ